MEYIKPQLRCIDEHTDMVCEDGSGASSSGCTVGDIVGTSCHVGAGDSDCVDGNSATACYQGNSPSVIDYPRCWIGYSAG